MEKLVPVLLAAGFMDGLWPIVWIVVGVALLVIGLVFMRFFRLWIQCKTTKSKIGILDLIGMQLRKVRAETIVRARIMAVQSNLNVKTTDLESLYLAGGNVPKVIRALISASRADIEMDFRRAAAIDLAGRDVEEAVQTSVNPKIIDIPPASSGRSTIDAVAKDGIMLRAKARVTVRTNINQLIGGATEETIVARVGEGIVSTIGSAETYKAVLQQPDQISKNVLASGLDAGSAFEILSIDISQIEVGENVGARLQADQAEADQRRARAHAEIRRALAVAREQEMVAQVQENRAKVVTAEAAVPEAIAAAFRTGQFSNQSKQGA